MDERWYNQPGENDDIIMISRIRLLRNFDGFKFPNRMDDDERRELVDRIDEKLVGLSEVTGSRIDKIDIDKLDPEERAALRERLLINGAAMEKNRSCVVYTGSDEAFSMTVNAEDHIRLIMSAHGQILNGLYSRMDQVDDFIGSRMPYAFSKKLGFKTASLSNTGTGLRAYYIMHLPLLSEEASFSELTAEMGKYGVVIKESWSQGARKVGGLYVLYNQRTLGMQEKDIIDILTRVAVRLMAEERKLRDSIDVLSLTDRVMRSYGILSYARTMDFAEGCRHLSNIMLGASTGVLKVSQGLTCYELMLGIYPGNLQVYFRQQMSEQELKEKRAEYLREFMQYIRPMI